MEIIIHKKMSRKIARDVHRLSDLMSEAGERPLVTFMRTHGLIVGKDGFFLLRSKTVLKWLMGRLLMAYLGSQLDDCSILLLKKKPRPRDR